MCFIEMLSVIVDFDGHALLNRLRNWGCPVAVEVEVAVPFQLEVAVAVPQSRLVAAAALLPLLLAGSHFFS